MLHVGLEATIEAEVYMSILSCGENEISTYCKSLVLKLDGLVGWDCSLTYGDKILAVAEVPIDLPTILPVTILTLSFTLFLSPAIGSNKNTCSVLGLK